MPSIAHMHAAFDCLDELPFRPARHREALRLIFLVPLAHAPAVNRFLRATYAKGFRDRSPALAGRLARTLFAGCFDGREDGGEREGELVRVLARYIAADA